MARVAPGSRIWMGLRFPTVLALVSPLAVTAGSYAPTELPNNALVIIQSHARERAFCTEIVSDAAALKKGLMHRTSLNPTAGMLFLFDPPREVRFWMKNTLIPLDMLFIDTDGRIVAIAHRTEPGSLRLFGPREPVSAVLEINGGLSEQLGIGAGDTVRTDAARDCE